VPNVEPGLIQWDQYEARYVDPKTVSQEAFGESAFGALTPGLSDARRMTELKNEIVDYLYKTAGLNLMYNPQLEIYGQPGMRRRDFLVMAQNAARQRRDEEIDRVTAQFEKQFDAAEAKLRKAARDLASEQKQLDALKSEELFTTGEAVMSLLLGRTPHTLARGPRPPLRQSKECLQIRAVISRLEAT
jgi:hypothetical protein